MWGCAGDERKREYVCERHTHIHIQRERERERVCTCMCASLCVSVFLMVCVYVCASHAHIVVLGRIASFCRVVQSGAVFVTKVMWQNQYPAVDSCVCWKA
jgi:hypothetical protein